MHYDKKRINSICKEKDEKANYIISECQSVILQEYNSRYGRVATISHWELCKLFQLYSQYSCFQDLFELRISFQTSSGIRIYDPSLVMLEKRLLIVYCPQKQWTPAIYFARVRLDQKVEYCCSVLNEFKVVYVIVRFIFHPTTSFRTDAISEESH